MCQLTGCTHEHKIARDVKHRRRFLFGLAIRLHAGPDHIGRDFGLSANVNVEAQAQVVIVLPNGDGWLTPLEKYR